MWRPRIAHAAATFVAILKKIGLRVLDEFGAVITHQAQEYLLRNIVKVGCGNAAPAQQELAQRGAPLAKPVREAALGIYLTHGSSGQTTGKG